MDPHLKALITAKRLWSEPLRPEEISRGFKGWYASKSLPHFDAPGVQQFITYRLADSVPAACRQEWENILALEDEIKRRKHLEIFLDRGFGECILQDQCIAAMVQENLWHHDGCKYRLLAWVLMPNHVHTLIEQWVPLSEIMHSWKSFTSSEANRILGRTGGLWANDYFDRYIRDEEHFRKVVHYIENNPLKSRMARTHEDWPWSSARYRSKENFNKLTHPGSERVEPLWP